MNLSSFRSEVFSLEKSKELAVEMLEDNVKKFRDFLDRMDLGGEPELRGCTDGELDKLKSVRNVKSLLKRYKHIVETQD